MFFFALWELSVTFKQQCGDYLDDWILHLAMLIEYNVLCRSLKFIMWNKIINLSKVSLLQRHHLTQFGNYHLLTFHFCLRWEQQSIIKPFVTSYHTLKICRTELGLQDYRAHLHTQLRYIRTENMPILIHCRLCRLSMCYVKSTQIKAVDLPQCRKQNCAVNDECSGDHLLKHHLTSDNTFLLPLGFVPPEINAAFTFIPIGRRDILLCKEQAACDEWYNVTDWHCSDHL